MNIQLIRQSLAEKGIEFTPSQVGNIVNKIEKVKKSLLENPDLFCYMSIEDKQDLCRSLAEEGKELTLEELDNYIELANKIRDI